MTAKPATELTREHIESFFGRDVRGLGRRIKDLCIEALAHREPAGDAGEMCERLKRGVVTIGRWPPEDPDIEATEAVMEEAADLIQQQAARLAGLQSGDMVMVPREPTEAMKETAILDAEDGPEIGILIDLPNGKQIWSGEVSNSLFREQGETAMDLLGGNDNGVFVMSWDNMNTEIVCRAASVDHGIEIARALARAMIAASEKETPQ